jgi:F-type H+-transporting ATPase subunit b
MEGNPLGSLGINLPQLIAQIVNFGILVLVLYLFGFKSFMRTMDERSNKIKESLEAGERAKHEALKSEQEVAKRIEAASREAQKILDQAAQAAEEVRRKAVFEAKKEADAIIEKARAEISREREEAVAELRKEVADLAVTIAGKAISHSLDEKTQRQLIEDALKEATTFSAIKNN